MNIKYTLFVFAILFSGSCLNSNCCELLHTTKLNRDVYVEMFRTYCGGVHAGETYSYYVTDSLSYRFKIGEHHDHNSFTFELKEDSIKTYLTQPQKSKFLQNGGSIMDEAYKNINGSDTIRIDSFAFANIRKMKISKKKCF